MENEIVQYSQQVETLHANLQLMLMALSLELDYNKHFSLGSVATFKKIAIELEDSIESIVQSL